MKFIARHCVLWSSVMLLISAIYTISSYISRHYREVRLSPRKRHLQWNESMSVERFQQKESMSVRRFHQNESMNVRKFHQNVSMTVRRFQQDSMSVRRSERNGLASIRKSQWNKSNTFRTHYWNESISVRRLARNKLKNVREFQTNESMNVRQSPKWKRVLFYTTVFGKNPTKFWGKNVFKGCAVPWCVLSDEKNSILQSDAVIFHGRDMPLRLPSSRYPSQRWIYFIRENPQYTSPKAENYNDVFNWTMTYKRTSDIWAPYGSYSNMDSRDVTAFHTGNKSH